MLEDMEFNAIQEENARELVKRLLNVIEQLSADVRELRVENRRLRDENNRLKGEQGEPDIKGNKTQRAAKEDHSSEVERHKRRRRHKKSKQAGLSIDREEVLKVEASQLPADAKYKGCEAVVVQDLQIKTDNVLFQKEKYYSASRHKTYLAELPPGYAGQFGPGIKSLILSLYFGMGTSEPKIREFLENMGVVISDGQVSNLLIKKQHDLSSADKNVRRNATLEVPFFTVGKSIGFA